MKKCIILAMGMLTAISAFSQSVRFVENFDGNTTNCIASPSHVWERDTNYYVSPPAAYLGMVPNMVGDVTYLETPPYNLSAYDYVLLRFKHICKISPQDIVRIEYKISGQGWDIVPTSAYIGNAANYNTKGFSAGSYSQWMASDSLALPNPSWWREENFDVSFEIGSENAVQFRFVIEHGTAPGTQISYGWLLDDIEIIASANEVKPPIVEFIAPLISDTVYSTGPHTIRAKVKTQSAYLIQTPWLVYTATFNGMSVTDSVEMTHVAGDSLWSGSIPPFILGTTVLYSITGKDAQGNYTCLNSGYMIAKASHHFGEHSVSLISIDSPLQGQTVGGDSTSVIVTIRNRGDSALTSATIYWSVNEVVSSYTWGGNLAWDMITSVNLGAYIPRTGQYDTVLIWISSPNNATDPVLSDDTLNVISYGCMASITGNYTVGNSGIFSSIDDFLDVLKDCSPAGNITLLLESGIHAGNLDLTDMSNLMKHYTLTITSAAGDADSIIIRPLSGVGIKLANSNNLVIKNITVDAATSGTYAVQFTAACTNVVIRDCKLLANQTGTTAATGYAPVYKASGTGIVDSIFIINNILDGGYYGFYFYGGTSASYGQHIVFDSNTVSNPYYYGTYPCYVDFTNCSYNTILSRRGTSGISSTWYGLRMYYANGPAIGNHIEQRSNSITSPYGIYLSYYNYNNTTDTGLVANNEIMLYTTTTYSGIYAYSYTKARILHNSIFIQGSGAARGIEIYSSTSTSLKVKNNNIIMESSSAYPIYISSITYLSSHDMDYNNMFAPTNVGYAGGAKTDLTTWQQTVTTDLNSVRIRPEYIDSTVNLKLVDYTDVRCDVLSDVDRDIEKTFRLGAYTSMGCYHGISACTVNATMRTLTGWREGSVLGETDSIKIELRNTGIDTITSLTLHWSINGNTPTAVTWSGMLLTGQNLNLTLGSITYTVGTYTLKAWISRVNGVQDEDAGDDTLSVSNKYVCSAPLSGMYTIGTSGNFPTWEAALDRLSLCGINGDIVFAFQKGNYVMSFDLSNNAALFGNHTLTLTSATGKAEDVIFQTGTVGIILSNSNNIIIRDVTIDATAGTYGIQFTSACTNIVIRNCRLFANPTATTSGYVPIYKTSSTGIADSIFIINNILDGGYYGCCFYAGTSSAYGNDIVFDSNTVTNSHSYAVILGYGNFTSSYNTISSRTNNTGATWYGIYRTYTNGDVKGNHIQQLSNNITQPYGIYLTYYHYYNTTDTGLVANNEIMLYTTTTYSGIYAYSYTKAQIMHNSIYIQGSGAARGIEIYSSSTTSLKVKNNNIIMESSSAYPVYVSSTTYLSRYDMDYNNMFAPTNIGYAGAAKTTIFTWQQTVTTDLNSVRIRPKFMDSTVNLELVDYIDVHCDILPDVDCDINKVFRLGAFTSMGCYHGPTYSVNATMRTLTGGREGSVLGQTDSIKIQLQNTGTDAITSLTLHWTINGSTPTAVTWSDSLYTGQILNLGLGTITYAVGNYTVKAWISHVNGVQDEDARDDTLSISGYVCNAPLSGRYTIGASATDSFPTWEAALERLSICGINGDIIFAFQKGIYNSTSFDLSNNATLFGNHTLTLTSATGKATDVIFMTGTVGIILSNSNNIIIRDITIDATAGTYGVQFTSACTNVVIRNCRLFANPTATTTGYAPIYKASSTGIADSVFVINNILDGGYYGFYFYAGTGSSAYGNDIVFDSNTVTNSYYYATVLGYGNFTSSYNTISSRTNNTGATWYGIYRTYTNGDIKGNHIQQLSDNITQPYGMYLTYYHSNNTTDTGLVANNEIMLYTTTTYSGIYAYSYTKAKILHNSIHIRGSAAARGIEIYSTSSSSLKVKNNNIIMESSSAYPIYISSTTYLSSHDMDNNNMYAPTNAGYAGSAKTDLAAWRQTVTTDLNSVRIRPGFIDSTIHLELVDYSGLECEYLAEVAVDKHNAVRGGISAMGCYRGFAVYANNASLKNLQAASGSIFGTNGTIKAILVNMGTNPLTNVTLHWSFNGVIHSGTGTLWSGNLALGAKDTVVLGTLTYAPAGDYTIEAWIHDLGSQQDMFSGDDTAQFSAYICPSPMNGIYTIGQTGTFKTIEEAFDRMILCGISGNVTFEFEKDTYNISLDLRDVSLLTGNHILTLTSKAHNADSVIFITTGVGLLLGNSNNIIVKDITINARAGSYAVQFTDACSNVVIRNCRLLADTTTTSNTKAVIYKASGTGVVDSIFILNNLLDGGYYGFYFYGGTSSAYGKNIVFDSNTVSRQYYYGTYPYYVDFTSCSYNTILSRTGTSGIGSTWYGLRMYYANGDAIGNRIMQRSKTITQPYGIYLYYYNYSNTTDTGLIANNEIMLYATGSYYGIYTYYTRAAILHNSIYVAGTGTARGLYLEDNANNCFVVKHNNIVMESSTAYPVYLSGTTNVSKWTIDANNYYSPTYIGYAGSGRTSLTAWTSVVTKDTNSVNILPDFTDSTVNLQLNDYKGLDCTPLPEVSVDINGQSRVGITAIGCYHGSAYQINAMLTDASPWGNNVYAGVSDTVKVKVTNIAPTTITDVTIQWLFNGNLQQRTWSVSLLTGQSVILTVDTLTYILGNNTLDIWIENLGTLQDEVKADDSLHLTFYVCTTGFSGTHTVGATGMIATLEQALTQIKTCGAAGNITLELLPNTYTGSFDLSNISMGNYTLTITSSTNKATDVTIATTGTAFLLSNSHNITIKNLTIDLSGGLYGIQLNNSCNNITIRDCIFPADAFTTANTNTAIYAKTTGNNIRICNNEINGGYDGIDLTGGTNVMIDSNNIYNTYHYGITANGSKFVNTGISFNTIHRNGTGTDWWGIYLTSSSGNITANRISCLTMYKPNGIYLSEHNANESNAGLIANNEIVLQTSYYSIYHGASDYTLYMPYGMRTDNSSYVAFIHNSIYMFRGSSQGAAIGIDIRDIPNKLLTIKNNNVCMTTGSAALVSASDQIRGGVGSSIIRISPSTTPSQYDVDYNNLYYMDGSPLTDWRQKFPNDKHSVNIKPIFVDTAISLEFTNVSDFECPFTSEVLVDINGTPRSANTLMGAYTGMASGFDVMLQKITRMDNEIVVAENVKVGVEFMNAGSAVGIDSVSFRWSLNGVTQPKSYTWRTSSPLVFGQMEEIVLDSFTVSGSGTADVIVWIETVNGIQDSLSVNDTLFKTARIVPLASFAAPFVADTINALSFDIHVSIKEKTGALLVTQVYKMAIQTTMGNGNIIHDTVTMQYNAGTDLWVAHIPQQYYGSTVLCSLTVTDMSGYSVILTKKVFLQFSAGGETYTGYNLGIASIDGLDPNELCSPDYATLSVTLTNSGTQYYNLANYPVNLYLQVTTPNPFYLDTVIEKGGLASGDNLSIKLTNLFPIYTGAQYDIKVWIESMVDNIDYDDTLLYYYVSGKFGLPIDADFSGEIPVEFASVGNNTLSKWEPVPQGSGRDTTIVPVFGTDMLSFVGSRGAMTTLSTRQLDLSRTVEPSLSFWYFHDTLPSKDYTDVRVTENGGQTYTTLFSLTKYNPVYGWKQYDVDLPPFGNGQCVILVFEAMEKSLQANTVQYIDRVRITARQDITLSEVLLPELTPCSLQNRELKVVMTNLGDIAVNYTNTPTRVTLEIQETRQTFTRDLTSDYLAGFSSDTITVKTGFDFAKGTYTFKAYFSTLLDVNMQNDTFVSQPVTINPVLSVSVHPESSPANCLTGEWAVNPTVNLYNTGNMDLSDIDIILQVDTGESNPTVYALFKERYTNTVLAGDTAIYMFGNAYTVPWNARYYVRATAYLGCDSVLVNNTNMITECVDVTDLRIISIDNPFEANDTVGNSIQVTATLNNRSDYDVFPNARITVVVENALREQIESFTETQTVGLLVTTSHTFTASYTVPDDSVYYLTVFVDSYDNYSDNDTITIRRETVKRSQDPEPPEPPISIKGIDGAERFTLSQNVPNPANNSTRIDYSIPEAGEVIFHLHSVSGQLLYSKTVEAPSGKQSLELNTSVFSAGIYFYSVEYKGQWLVKRMIIQ